MPDDDLLELNNQFDGLTDDAQNLLRNELSRRKLPTSPAVLSAMAEAPSEYDVEVTVTTPDAAIFASRRCLSLRTIWRRRSKSSTAPI